MGYWIRFVKDGTGIPDSYSGSWFEGSEWIENATSTDLDTCRWTGSEWVLRGPEPIYEPTKEEVAALREAEYQQALEIHGDLVREALSKEADPWFFKYQAGESTKEEWLAVREEVKARYPKPIRQE